MSENNIQVVLELNDSILYKMTQSTENDIDSWQ